MKGEGNLVEADFEVFINIRMKKKANGQDDQSNAKECYSHPPPGRK